MAQPRRRVSKRVTIADIAQAAQVSISTVSNVLNHRPNAMTEETLERVQAVIREMDYHPSSVARSLATDRTATLGVIIAEIETPLFLQAFSFIEPLAREAGYNLLVTKARTIEDEKSALKLLLGKQVDGVIFLSVTQYVNDDYLLGLQQQKVPAVLINRAAIHAEFDHINWDETSGIGLAVEHLAQLGHQYIAHLRGPLERQSGNNRLEGYKIGLEQCGLTFRGDYVRSGDYTANPDLWRQSTLELLDLSPRPTAIICANDLMALGAISAIQEQGLTVGRDVSVVGFDDVPWAQHSHPPLTTVHQPVYEIGKRVCHMLIQLIRGEELKERHIVLQPEFIVRESTGPASQ